MVAYPDLIQFVIMLCAVATLVLIATHIQTSIKSKPFETFIDFSGIQTPTGLDFFYHFNPQKSTKEPSLFFHFLEIFLSFSYSIVARALRSSSVVMSRYTIVVSSCS